MENKAEIFGKVLKNDLASFVKKSFKTLDPVTELEWNWHLDLICLYLEAAYRGEIKRLIINVPPRSLKSITVNVSFPAWCIANKPSFKIISSSFRENLSIKHNVDTRRIMQSDWYQKYFPQVQFLPEQNSKAIFTTTEGGGKECATMAAPPMGSGANIIIIDDPHSTKEAQSQVERMKVCEGFGQDFVPRLNNQKEGTIVIIMQRLHDRDLTGYLLSEHPGEYVHLNIPAIAPEDITYYYPNSDKVFYEYKKGEYLSKNRLDASVLDKLKKKLGSYAFEGQYMQNPFPEGGGMVKDHWWRTYDPNTFDTTGCEIYISLDAAGKTGLKNDPSVFTIWAKKGEDHYLLDVVREKLEFPDLKKKAKLLLEKWKPNGMIIEDASSGTALIQDLKTETIYNIIGIKLFSYCGKEVRLESCVAMIEAGQVFLPSTASWVLAFREELMKFPSATHDDQVDSTTMYLNYIRNKRAVWEII